MLDVRHIAISEIGRVVTGRTPPTRRPELIGNGVAFITPTDMSENSIFPAPERRLSAQGAHELASVLLPAGAVCFTCIASIGKMCFTNELSVTNQQVNSIIVDEKRFNARWLFYSLRDNRGRIAKIASGSATPIINKSSFGRVVLATPKLRIQQRIAEILGAYDDLIDANRRRVSLLEDMARGLFEEWFVRFRFPDHQAASFFDTPDGPRPASWETKTVGQLGNILTGKTPSKTRADYYGADVPFIKIPDMTGNVFVTSTTDMLSTAGAASQASKSVPGRTLLVSCIGTIGLVSITTSVGQTNQQINAMVPYNQQWTEYLYFTLIRLRSHLINLGSNGATMGNVNKTKFSALAVTCPPEELISQFHCRAGPIFDAILALSKQNNLLGESRDLLLPRLISGRLLLSDAERELAEAA